MEAFHPLSSLMQQPSLKHTHFDLTHLLYLTFSCQTTLRLKLQPAFLILQTAQLLNDSCTKNQSLANLLANVNCIQAQFYIVVNCLFLDHGADDDLKLLNVIESFCKAKQQPRQSINVQDMIVSAISKSSILPTASKIGAGDSPIHEANNIQNYVGSTNQVEPAVKQADLNKLADEKM